MPPPGRALSPFQAQPSSHTPLPTNRPLPTLASLTPPRRGLGTSPPGPPMSPIASHNDVFADALKRLESAAQDADVPPETIHRLSAPKQFLEVTVPLRLDNGQLALFTGYRCRY